MTTTNRIQFTSFFAAIICTLIVIGTSVAPAVATTANLIA